MPSALSRDTNARALVVSANSLSGTTGAFAPPARTPPLAWFIVTSIFGSSRASRDRAVSARSPQGRSIAARILSDNHLTPMAALSGARPLALARLGVGTAPAARYHDSSAVYSCRSPVGHFDQFPPTSPSVGCRFGQRTFAGATRNGRDAPVADLRRATTANRVRYVAQVIPGHRSRCVYLDRIARAGSYPCRKRRSASRLSCSACLVTRAFVAR